jgi:hypothetical protein
MRERLLANSRKSRTGFECHAHNMAVATQTTGRELFDILRNYDFRALLPIRFDRNAINVGQENLLKIRTAKGRW